jgi:hypothetical protein
VQTLLRSARAALAAAIGFALSLAPAAMAAAQVESSVPGPVFQKVRVREQLMLGVSEIKLTAGSGFMNNVVHPIVIFHAENGAWKLWDEKVLGVQLPAWLALLRARTLTRVAQPHAGGVDRATEHEG